jgi:hypothetical protein
VQNMSNDMLNVIMLGVTMLGVTKLNFVAQTSTDTTRERQHKGELIKADLLFKIGCFVNR